MEYVVWHCFELTNHDRCNWLLNALLKSSLCGLFEYALSGPQKRFEECLPQKQSHYTPWKRLGREEVQLLLIIDLGARWGRIVNVTPRPWFNSGERNPNTHCTGGWMGPRADLVTEARGKIFRLCRGSNLDHPVVQPLARHCTDRATRLTNFTIVLSSSQYNISYISVKWFQRWDTRSDGHCLSVMC
jgi:hypothetical protein